MRAGLGSSSVDSPEIPTCFRLYLSARYPNAAWLVTKVSIFQLCRPAENSPSSSLIDSLKADALFL